VDLLELLQGFGKPPVLLREVWKKRRKPQEQQEKEEKVLPHPRGMRY
jgi:hypothetical protein